MNHEGDDNDDKDGKCGAQSDSQGDCHCGVVAGRRRRPLSGFRQVTAFQRSRPDYEHRQQTDASYEPDLNALKQWKQKIVLR